MQYMYIDESCLFFAIVENEMEQQINIANKNVATFIVWY